jgi:hypothetical protein
MRRPDLSGRSNEQLIARFVGDGEAQYQALIRLDNLAYDKMIRDMMYITSELKWRVPDARPALLPLLSHPNVSVRLAAARICMRFAVAQALPVVRDIEANYSEEIGMEASDILSNYESGEYEKEWDDSPIRSPKAK